MNVNKSYHRTGLVCLLFVSIFMININSYGQTKENHILWQVSKNNKVEGYLMGTIHFVDSTFFPIDSIYIEILNKSNPIVFELADGGISKMSIISSMIYSGIYKNGETLKENIPLELYEKAKKRLEEVGISNPDNFKPWLVALIIHAFNSSNSGEDMNGIDGFMHKEAVNQKKNIIGLEKPKEQIRIFSNRSKATQIELLKFVLGNEDLKTTKTITANVSDKSLSEYWKSGDIKQIKELIRSNDFENIANVSDEMRKYLVIKRNKSWENKIEKLFREENLPMIIVGLGHLLGKDNLINLLEIDGYKIKQL